jgi:hypothetical protein
MMSKKPDCLTHKEAAKTPEIFIKLLLRAEDFSRSNDWVIKEKNKKIIDDILSFLRQAYF